MNGTYEVFQINFDRYFEEFLGDAEIIVRVYETTEELNSIRGRDSQVDAYMNIIDGHMTMHFSADLIAMALVVHESIHAMFWNYDRLMWRRPKMKPRKTINVFHHPESMVHFGGNLATIVWGQITQKYPPTI